MRGALHAKPTTFSSKVSRRQPSRAQLSRVQGAEGPGEEETIHIYSRQSRPLNRLLAVAAEPMPPSLSTSEQCSFESERETISFMLPHPPELTPPVVGDLAANPSTSGDRQGDTPRPACSSGTDGAESREEAATGGRRPWCSTRGLALKVGS